MSTYDGGVPSGQHSNNDGTSNGRITTAALQGVPLFNGLKMEFIASMDQLLRGFGAAGVFVRDHGRLTMPRDNHRGEISINDSITLRNHTQGVGSLINAMGDQVNTDPVVDTMAQERMDCTSNHEGEQNAPMGLVRAVIKGNGAINEEVARKNRRERGEGRGNLTLGFTEGGAGGGDPGGGGEESKHGGQGPPEVSRFVLADLRESFGLTRQTESKAAAAEHELLAVKQREAALQAAVVNTGSMVRGTMARVNESIVVTAEAELLLKATETANGRLRAEAGTRQAQALLDAEAHDYAAHQRVRFTRRAIPSSGPSRLPAPAPAAVTPAASAVPATGVAARLGSSARPTRSGLRGLMDKMAANAATRAHQGDDRRLQLLPPEARREDAARAAALSLAFAARGAGQARPAVMSSESDTSGSISSVTAASEAESLADEAGVKAALPEADYALENHPESHPGETRESLAIKLWAAFKRKGLEGGGEPTAAQLAFSVMSPIPRSPARALARARKGPPR